MTLAVQEAQPVRDLILDVVIPFQFELLTDAKPTAGEAPGLGYMRAVGAVSDVRYQSGRVIPSLVQSAAIADAKAQGRQMTMFIGHPQPGVDVSWENVFAGRLEDIAAVVEQYHFDATTKQTVLDRIRILDTRKGQALLGLAKAGVKVGISQRATGRWEEQELKIDGQWVPCVVVQQIFGIWGWDAVHLPVANAGDVTQAQLTDSIISGGRSRTEGKKMAEIAPVTTETNPPASKGLGQSILDMLDQMQKRADMVLPTLKANSAEAQGIYRQIYQGQAQVRSVLDSSEDEGQKQQKLAVLANQVMTDFRALPTVAASAVVQAGGGDTLTVKQITDQMVERAKREDHILDLKRFGAELLAKEEKIPDDDRQRVQSLVDTFCGPHVTRDQVKTMVDAQIDHLHKLAARIGLARIGQEQPKAKGINDALVTGGGSGHLLDGANLEGARALFDALCLRGGYDPTIKKPEDVHPKVKMVLDAFDRIHERRLLEEKPKLMALRRADGSISDQAVGQYIGDSSVKADFDTPATLSRLVISEVYALPIFRELTDFGVMVSQVDQVPVERWRGDGDALTFRPTVAQRNAVRGELIPIPQGRHFVDFITLTAIGRKLGTTMSLEFLTRAKRHPQITGVAMAIAALVKNMQRILQQDIFDEQFWAATMHGSTPLDVTKTGDGSASTFQIIGTTPADAVTIVPNRPVKSELLVEVGTTSGNRQPVPEFGTSTSGGGPDGTWFYTIDHVLAKITFVDADQGALIPASSANNIRVRGRQATAQVRFDLKLPTDITQEQHMLSLLFEVSNLRAKLSSGGISSAGFYDADYLLASVATSEFMKQARTFAMLERRNAYKADAEITEGNYGTTAGLGHWGSKVQQDDRIIVGTKMGTLFYQYEPPSLRGPVEGVNSSGKLIGAQEYYTYGEDSILAPVEEKFASIGLYRSA